MSLADYIHSGRCPDCGWSRNAMLTPDARIVLSLSSDGRADHDASGKCADCRRWIPDEKTAWGGEMGVSLMRASSDLASAYVERVPEPKGITARLASERGSE